MAAPNLATATTMVGKTAVVDLTSTNTTVVLSNSANSNTLMRVISLYVSNVDGVNNADITVSYYSNSAANGTATEICKTVVVPADATLVVVDKDAPIYLEENRSLAATASAANDLRIVCSYEEIS